MKGFTRKSKKINILQSKVFLIVLIVLAVLLGKGAFKMYKRAHDTNAYLSLMSAKYAQLEQRYDDTFKDLEYINSNTGTEKEIREKFDVAKEGEKTFVIIEDEIEVEPIIQKKSIWQKFVNWVSF